MSDTPEHLEQQFLTFIKKANSSPELEAIRVKALGKKGALIKLLKNLGTLPQEQRRQQGKILNTIKDRLHDALTEKAAELLGQRLNEDLHKEALDPTLPIEKPATSKGRIHPVSQAFCEAIAILSDLGFTTAQGPEIETEYYNFTALNIPDHHPARQMHDTFYLDQDEKQETLLLRTHTSGVQIHTMKKKPPPLRIIAPGRVYRRDYDPTHTPVFHQIEGFAIEKNLHMGHLKWVLERFLQTFFEKKNLAVRFRTSYFPFTEPSMEVDIALPKQKNGAPTWMEVLGCGMIHPNVLRHTGLDSTQWQGFAFGLGLDRLAMLKYGINDLRTFFENDIRWLHHYGFPAFYFPSVGRNMMGKLL